MPNSHGRRTATSQQHYERTLCLSSENEREEGDIAGRSVSEERVKPEIGIRAERTEPAAAKGTTAANLRFDPVRLPCVGPDQLMYWGDGEPFAVTREQVLRIEPRAARNPAHSTARRR